MSRYHTTTNVYLMKFGSSSSRALLGRTIPRASSIRFVVRFRPLGIPTQTLHFSVTRTGNFMVPRTMTSPERRQKLTRMQCYATTVWALPNVSNSHSSGLFPDLLFSGRYHRLQRSDATGLLLRRRSNRSGWKICSDVHLQGHCTRKSMFSFMEARLIGPAAEKFTLGRRVERRRIRKHAMGEVDR